MYLLVPLFPIIVKKILGRALYFVRFDFLLFMKMICFAKKHWPRYCLYFVHFHTCSIIFQYVLCNNSRKENSRKVCTRQTHISIHWAPVGAQQITLNVYVLAPVPYLPHPRSKLKSRTLCNNQLPQHHIKVFLTPTGAQGKLMSVCLSVKHKCQYKTSSLKVVFKIKAFKEQRL